MRSNGPSINDTLWSCKWRNETVSCTDIFSTTLTEEGICYSFNSLTDQDIFRTENVHTDYKYLDSHKSTDHWSVEKGYSMNEFNNSYPWRVRDSGKSTGLNVAINRLLEHFDCNGLREYDVYLHLPGEVPRISKRKKRSILKNYDLVIKPQIMVASEGLREFAPRG